MGVKVTCINPYLNLLYSTYLHIWKITNWFCSQTFWGWVGGRGHCRGNNGWGCFSEAQEGPSALGTHSPPAAGWVCHLSSHKTGIDSFPWSLRSQVSCHRCHLLAQSSCRTPLREGEGPVVRDIALQGWSKHWTRSLGLVPFRILFGIQNSYGLIDRRAGFSPRQ